MKRLFRSFTLLSLLSVAFFALITWNVDAQRSLLSSGAVSDTQEMLSPARRERILADRASDTGLKTDLSIVARANPEVGTTIYAYDFLNNRLVSFDAAAPGTYLTNIPLTGFDWADHFLEAIDFRPSNGLLYAVLSNGFPGRERVVTIDLATGAVVPVSPTNSVATQIDSFWALDFDPVTDRLRAIGTTESNRRFDPNDGTLAGTDTTIRYTVADPNFGVNPNLAHSAYTINVPLSNSTLYGIDVTANVLVRVGGINGSPSPNTGELTTIGPLGLDPSNFGAMDIQQGTNIAYAALFISSVPTLVRIDLSTGAASVIGTIGDGTGIIDGLSIPLTPIAPLPTPSPSPTPTPEPNANTIQNDKGREQCCNSGRRSAYRTH